MPILYSLPTCGICRVIKMKLQQKNIQFIESHDLKPLQNKLNIERVPILQIDENTFLTTPLEINNWINNQG